MNHCLPPAPTAETNCVGSVVACGPADPFDNSNSESGTGASPLPTTKIRVVSTNEWSKVVGNADKPYRPAYSCSVKPPAGSMRSVGVPRAARFAEFSAQPGLLTVFIVFEKYGAIDVKSDDNSAPLFSWICALTGRM